MKEKQDILVSVIVPVYNVEQYIQRCIDSITKQTYSNIEIILVDDGSDDNSGGICDRAALLDKRIHVIHKKNGGLSSARNIGIDSAHGEYICFVDSDDVIVPCYVELLLGLCVENNAQISMGKFEKFNKDFLFEQKRLEDRYIYENRRAVELLIDGSYVQYVVAWNKLYDRSLFNEIRYPDGLLYEDEGTTYKLFYKANKVVVTNSVVYGYFVREGSITQSNYSIKKLDFLKIAKERCDYFAERKEKRLRDLFLFMYAFGCLNVYPKVKRDLKRKDIAKQIKWKYYKALPKLLKSSDISVKRKAALIIFGGLPWMYEKYINFHIK